MHGEVRGLQKAREARLLKDVAVVWNMCKDLVKCASSGSSECLVSIAILNALLHRLLGRLRVLGTLILGCISQLETICAVFVCDPEINIGCYLKH